MGCCEGHLATAALDVLGVMKYQGNILESLDLLTANLHG